MLFLTSLISETVSLCHCACCPRFTDRSPCYNPMQAKLTGVLIVNHFPAWRLKNLRIIKADKRCMKNTVNKKICLDNPYNPFQLWDRSKQIIGRWHFSPSLRLALWLDFNHQMQCFMPTRSWKFVISTCLYVRLRFHRCFSMCVLALNGIAIVFCWRCKS
jgi:hypothetical protein